MKDIKLVVGIEVECEYNRDKFSLQKSNYHGNDISEMGRFFCIERDSSLSSNTFSNGDTAEIISRPFLSSKSEEVLKSFEQEINQKGGASELKKLLSFNRTTGCHLNFSAYKEGKDKIIVMHRAGNLQMSNVKDLAISRLATFDFCSKISTELHKRVKEQLGEGFYSKWASQFNRNYARKMNPNSFGRERTLEYNTGSENRIEFRSFNLYGVETWEQFHKLILIGINTIKDQLNQELEAPQPFFKRTEYRVTSEDDGLVDSRSEVVLTPNRIISVGV